MSVSLQQLFDLQCFMENSRLQALIQDTMERYGGEDIERRREEKKINFI